MQTTDYVSRLCPHCALCCNGVLFADVRLQEGDDAEDLKKLGLPLRSRGAVTRFTQPCACLDGKSCRIYTDRPARCRSFECRLLQRAEAEEISETAALKTIREARRRAEKVRRLLRELGDTNETVPLSRRYQRMMRQPIDLAAGDYLCDLRGELMLAVGELVGLLERDFLG